MAARIPVVSRTVDSDGTNGAEPNILNESHSDRLKKEDIMKSTAQDIRAGSSDTPRTDDTDSAATNPFNESHFDRLKKQGIVKSTTPDIMPGTSNTPRTDGTDGAETNPFNEAHFDRLREQGVTDLFNQDGTLELDQCREHAGGDAIPPRLGIHQLELEQAPQLRVLFQQYEGDTKVTLTAETTKELPVGTDGIQTVLGAMHSRAEIAWSCKAQRIKVTMYPIPWKDEILVHNETTRMLFLESVPNGLDVFVVRPKEFAGVYPGFWRLSDGENTIEFLLRPRRYHLLLKTDATKRTSEQPLPPAKRSKQSTTATVTRAAEIPSSLAQQQKTIIRPTAVDVDMLTSIGLGQNQTLNMVNSVTGQLEYSIKCIDRYLKRGDYADVFKAVWKDGSSRPAVVAVKVHKIATAAEPYHIAAAVERWKRELEAQRHLEHPSIANLLAFDSRLLALIIEHRDAHDLATPQWCFRSGPNAGHFRGSLDDACQILADVSSALAYLADQDIVHNDIKAGNILYRAADPTGGRHKASAAVIDFGLSRNVKTQQDDFGGGSPWYLPPEWLHGGRRGPRADIFSLGVVMLYLLRCITLPDMERGWNVNAIQQHAPDARASMKAWLDNVRCRADELDGDGASSKETKLRSLVRRMLVDEGSRISACNLVTQTAEWASY